MVRTLDAHFAAAPPKVGTVSPDPAGTFHSNPNCPTTCADAVTIMRADDDRADDPRAGHADAVVELKVNPARLPDVGSDQLCGFKEGMRVLIMSPDGDYDIFTITNVRDRRATSSTGTTSSTHFPAGS